MTRRRSDAAVAFAKTRGISLETLMALGVVSDTVYFPDVKKRLEALIFPYRGDDWKARALDEKLFATNKGFVREFWGLADVIEARSDTVYIVEGELDRCAMVEAGLSPGEVLAALGGNDKPISDPDSDRRYAYVEVGLAAGLNRVKTFVWCGDSDHVGRLMREEMIRLLGAGRCQFVDWPDGIKDANDMLMKDGDTALRELVVDGALDWPIVGLFRLSELPEPIPLQTWSTGFPGWDSHVMLGRRTLSVVTGQPGSGKALALNTPIPTPSGWKTMGELNPGDLVFDEQGEPCNVTFATPFMADRKCYRVVFDDGSEIIADAEHQWLTETVNARLSEIAWKRRGSRKWVLPKGNDQSWKRTFPSVVTTEQISNSLLSANGKRNHAIRLTRPVRYASKKLPIPPYSLGAWLGDGSSMTPEITCSGADRQIIDEICAEGIMVTSKKVAMNKTPQWRMSTAKKWAKDGLSKTLRSLGLLGNKHIPDIYLQSSDDQRIALLQGLMDTDGYVSKNGHAEFCTTSRKLADGIYELLCSLGVRPGRSTGVAKIYGREISPKYRITFVSTILAFRLKRKRDLIPQGSRYKYRYIKDCIPIPSVLVKCIQVDSPSSLYLAGRTFIPTHNTILWGQIWAQVADQNNVRVCVASFENPVKPHIRRQLRGLRYNRAERYLNKRERDEADEWIDDHYLFLVHPQRKPELDWFLQTAEAAVVKYGAAVVQLDPWNKLEGARPPGVNEKEYIEQCLRSFYNFAVDLNCHFQIIAHPSKLEFQQRKRAPELEDISGAKAWDAMVDQGFVVHRPKMFEGAKVLTNAEFYCRKSRFEELGHPCRLDVEYSIENGRFYARSPLEANASSVQTEFDQV